MSHILTLLEKQIARSNLCKSLGETTPQPGQYVTEEGAAFGPCLLISREYGSGGGRLAQRAGERLGWNIFDARMVDEIMHSAHVQRRLVECVDERVRSHWESTWRDFLLDDLADQKYLRHLKEAVKALGHLGNVVLVGRGAQFMLPTRCGLRVHLVAPMELRAKRVAEDEKLSLDEARLKVETIDGERANFIRKIFKEEIGAPLNHDLIINTDEISIAGATELVLAAMEQKLGVPVKGRPVSAGKLSKSK